jgi:hypothetical protein
MHDVRLLPIGKTYIINMSVFVGPSYLYPPAPHAKSRLSSLSSTSILDI